MTKKSLLIWSGGLDSTSLLFELIHQGHDVTCVHFYYGSKHNKKEEEAIDAIAEKYGIKVKTIDLDFINIHFKSDLLLAGDAIPEGHYADENMKKTVVPFRNGIMLSIAVGIAESLEINEVYLGSHAGDHTIYPDCRPEFTEAMHHAASRGTWNQVSIFAPFAYHDKGMVCRIGHDANAPLELTWTCYKGQEVHCGKCGACVERKEAFEKAGVIDPTIYADKPQPQILSPQGVEGSEKFGMQ